MVFLTGDIHGFPDNIKRFCRRLNGEDVLIILGDVGANFWQDARDDEVKCALDKLPPKIFCIHGNHEIRPSNLPTYRQKEWNGGCVWYEDAYPNLLFARDGDVFTMDGMRYLVIGGAYSVDKYYRLMKGFGWWPDEQPSEEIKRYVEQQVKEREFDIVLSHTCPYKYEPTEMFLGCIDQSTVDDSTEHWLDKIEESIEYKAWFCGHWHTDKRVDKMHFLFNTFESAEQFKNEED